MLEKQEKRHRRHKRVRAKIWGTSKVPRLSVFRSNQHIYAQLINDEKGITLVSASGLDIKKSLPRRQAGKKVKKTDKAKEVGKLIAEKALQKKIKEVIFDRGGYKYHGRVKALAQGAREGGLKF